MRKEAASHATPEHITNTGTPATSGYTYEVVDTVQDIAATMKSLIETRAEQLAVVTIRLHFEHEGRAYTSWLAQAKQSARFYLDNLRPLVRKTDAVFLSSSTFYFLLLGANLQGGNIVQDRLWEALLWRVHNSNEGDALRPAGMTIGHSAFPAPYSDIYQCIAAAREVRQSFGAQPEVPVEKTTIRCDAATPEQVRDAELPALARKLGVPYLSLLPRRLSPKVQQLVSPQLAHELRCYPLGREHNILTVAMLNPRDSRALDRLRQETGLRIFPVLAHPHELQTALEQLV